MKMRPFTTADWYGFASAETDADGTPPHMSEVEILLDGDPAFVIADSTGIEIWSGEMRDDGDPDPYTLRSYGTKLNVLIAQALGDDITGASLLALGFWRG